MDTQHKAIRALLSSMAPARAEEAVRLVGLPPDEETAVLAVDVHGQSCLQTAERLHVSVDTVKRLRRSAYRKLQDEIYTTR
jgi:DNA-directed RNA polymerase specialized sigma24 family protein